MVCDASLNFCGRCGQRLRGASPTMCTIPLASSTPLPATAPAPRSVSLSFLIMMCVCIFSVLFAIGTGIFALTRPSNKTTATTPVHVTLVTSKPIGRVWFYTTRSQDDSVAVHLNSLPKLASGTVYIAWLINPLRPDQFLAIGPILPDSHGQALLKSDTLPAFNTQSQNLRRVFTQVSVTIEKMGAQGRRPTGSPLLQGDLNQKTLDGLAPLFTYSLYTPKQISLLSGLQSQMHGLARWLANMLDAQQHKDAGNVRVDLSRFIYLLEGTHGTDVASLHLTTQQNVTSVGDGLGLLSSNETNCQHDSYQCGYLDLMQETVQTLLTQHLVQRTSAQRVVTTLSTMRQLAQSIQQEAMSLITLSKIDMPTLQKLTMLEVHIDAFLNGSDSNGDGTIDAVPGEAATAQLYGYVQQLGAIGLS